MERSVSIVEMAAQVSNTSNLQCGRCAVCWSCSVSADETRAQGTKACIQRISANLLSHGHGHRRGHELCMGRGHLLLDTQKEQQLNT